ncbi:MAG: alpha/beta fold hydrolase, partial [Bacteroidia bacterium]
MKFTKRLKALLAISFPVLVVIIFTSARSQQLPSGKMKKGAPIVIGEISYNTIEGMIDVPEDYNNPAGRRLQLPFYVVKSNNSNPAEPIFWLDGGPGASNILNEKKIATSSPAKLLANHDLVCVGYRGVDGSTVLKSDKVNKAMKGLNHKMLSEASLKNIEAEIKKYCAQLKNNGIDINNYTIMQVIEDIEQVRKLLNYSTINLLSVSYGTRVALIYSYKYPEVLKRTVMIGACPPGYFLTRPEQAEYILTYYDSIYQSQNNQVSIRDAMRKAFEQMPKRWSGFRLDADKIKTGTLIALYSRNFAMVAFDAYFKAANKGDYSG